MCRALAWRSGLTPALLCMQVVLASLQNGNVLTAGGKNSSNVVLAEAEVFNVLSRTWQPVGNMLSPRYFHEVWDQHVTASLGLVPSTVHAAVCPAKQVLSGASFLRHVTTWTCSVHQTSQVLRLHPARCC